MSATGPSFFVDVQNCTYLNNSVTTSIFAMKSIRVNRNRTQLQGFDNNRQRPVAVHSTRINETITIETEDVNALQALLNTVGPGTLVFTALPAAHTTDGSSLLGPQLYTFTNYVIQADSVQFPMAGFASGSISGFTMENSAGDGTDAFGASSTSSSTSSN